MPDLLGLLEVGCQKLLDKPLTWDGDRQDETVRHKIKVVETLLFILHVNCSVLTRVQQVCILISQNLVGQEIVSISIERQEGHHVETIIVANGGIGTWVAGPGRLVGSEPALEDAAEGMESEDKKRKKVIKGGGESAPAVSLFLHSPSNCFLSLYKYIIFSVLISLYLLILCHVTHAVVFIITKYNQLFTAEKRQRPDEKVPLCMLFFLCVISWQVCVFVIIPVNESMV